MAETLDVFGKIDILVNNVAVSENVAFLNLEREAWERAGDFERSREQQPRSQVERHDPPVGATDRRKGEDNELERHEQQQ